MPLFHVLPPEFDRFVEMDRWGVVRDAKHGLRLVGREIGACERITSPVVQWDAGSQTATTASGRFYRLLGEPDPEYAAHVVAMHKKQWSNMAQVELVDFSEAVAALGKAKET
jgi:hypothetical protein